MPSVHSPAMNRQPIGKQGTVPGSATGLVEAKTKVASAISRTPLRPGAAETRKAIGTAWPAWNTRPVVRYPRGRVRAPSPWHRAVSLTPAAFMPCDAAIRRSGSAACHRASACTSALPRVGSCQSASSLAISSRREAGGPGVGDEAQEADGDAVVAAIVGRRPRCRPDQADALVVADHLGRTPSVRLPTRSNSWPRAGSHAASRKNWT